MALLLIKKKKKKESPFRRPSSRLALGKGGGFRDGVGLFAGEEGGVFWKTQSPKDVFPFLATQSDWSSSQEPTGGKAPRPARLVHVVPNDGVTMGRSLKTLELVLPGSMGRNTYEGETRDLKKSPAYDPLPSSYRWVTSHRNASSRPYRSPLVPVGRKDGQVTGWLSSTQSRQNVGCLMGFPNG